MCPWFAQGYGYTGKFPVRFITLVAPAFGLAHGVIRPSRRHPRIIRVSVLRHHHIATRSVKFHVLASGRGTYWGHRPVCTVCGRRIRPCRTWTLLLISTRLVQRKQRRMTESRVLSRMTVARMRRVCVRGGLGDTS
jgi:hypothetical protein